MEVHYSFDPTSFRQDGPYMNFGTFADDDFDIGFLFNLQNPIYFNLALVHGGLFFLAAIPFYRTYQKAERAFWVLLFLAAYIAAGTSMLMCWRTTFAAGDATFFHTILAHVTAVAGVWLYIPISDDVHYYKRRVLISLYLLAIPMPIFLYTHRTILYASKSAAYMFLAPGGLFAMTAGRAVISAYIGWFTKPDSLKAQIRRAGKRLAARRGRKIQLPSSSSSEPDSESDSESDSPSSSTDNRPIAPATQESRPTPLGLRQRRRRGPKK